MPRVPVSRRVHDSHLTTRVHASGLAMGARFTGVKVRIGILTVIRHDEVVKLDGQTDLLCESRVASVEQVQRSQQFAILGECERVVFVDVPEHAGGSSPSGQSSQHVEVRADVSVVFHYENAARNPYYAHAHPAAVWQEGKRRTAPWSRTWVPHDARQPG